VPGRPIGPWSRRTGAPVTSATGRDRSPRSVLGPWRTVITGARMVTSGHQRRGEPAGQPGLQVKQFEQHRSANQIVVPKVRLGALDSRRAATDRRRDQHDPSRTMVDRWSGRALTPAFSCGTPPSFPISNPSAVQAGRGSLDLTRKRSQVQTQGRRNADLATPTPPWRSRRSGGAWRPARRK
jgi:hypothetical protein